EHRCSSPVGSRVGSFQVQRLFGRRTRTLVPTAAELLRPEIPHNARDKLLQRKVIQSNAYNRHAKELQPLQQGGTVRIQPKPNDRTKQWIKGEVEDQVDVRSYNIRTEDGRVYRRNRRHLRKTKPTPHSHIEMVIITLKNLTRHQDQLRMNKQQLLLPKQCTNRKKQPPRNKSRAVEVMFKVRQ
ncbi:hypothetical protein AC249_AIPGENE10405, partial [Exaiptasia diaphana]